MNAKNERRRGNEKHGSEINRPRDDEKRNERKKEIDWTKTVSKMKREKRK